MLNIARVVNFYETTTSKDNYDSHLFIRFENTQERDDFVIRARTPAHAMISVNDTFVLFPLRKNPLFDASNAKINLNQEAYDELLSHLRALYPDSDKLRALSDTGKFSRPAEVIVVTENPFDISADHLLLDEVELTNIKDKLVKAEEQHAKSYKMHADLLQTLDNAKQKLQQTQDEINQRASEALARVTEQETLMTQHAARMQEYSDQHQAQMAQFVSGQQSENTRFTARLANTLGKTRIRQMPFQVSEPVPVQALPSEAQHIQAEEAEQNRSTMQMIKDKLASFINTPSQHPITLSIIGVTAAFAAGMSGMGMIVVGIGICAGIEIRNRAYSDPLTASSLEVFSAGRVAANNWPTYLNSYTNLNNWQHPLDFGKGLKQAMDEQEVANTVQRNRPQ